MLRDLFVSPTRVAAIRNGPAGGGIETFADQLCQRGYSNISMRRHIRAAEHLVRWAARLGVSPCDLCDPHLKRFADHLDRCHCGRYRCTKPVDVVTGARLFLNHLHGVRQPFVRDRRGRPADPRLLADFCAWMRMRRGTTDRTLYNYSIPIRALIRTIKGNPNTLNAHRLRQFILAQSKKGRFSAQRCRTAVRMFLKFLIAEGRCRVGLLGAIPLVASYRLAALPRYLSPRDVERLIACCPPISAVSKRDLAILLLLARLGLRAGDIVQMRLCDIDWVGAWVHVSGKSRRQTRLPLTREVGKAIAAYLQDGRGETQTDALFLRSRAPFHPLGSHAAVSMIVKRAFRRAGVKPPCRGAAHLLRHSLASSMLRQGASLQEIAGVLRHRSLESTQIYAKVDVAGLQEIAQPWPEIPSC